MVMEVMLIICRFNSFDASFVSFCEEIQPSDLYFQQIFHYAEKKKNQIFFFVFNRAEKEEELTPISED